MGRLIVFTQPSKLKLVNCDLVRSAICYNRNSIADLLAIGDSHGAVSPLQHQIERGCSLLDFGA